MPKNPIRTLSALAAVLIQLSSAGAADTTLPEVQIREGRKTAAPGAVRDEVVKTESVSAREIERGHAASLTDALDKRPGIAVQVECSVCNVRNVTLNNLPGRFTTLLMDGIPLYSSVSSAYGLDSVNLAGIERMDIARGAATSLTAPEALSGTVNIVTRRPREAENTFQLSTGGFGERRADAWLARPVEGGAITLSADYRRQDTVDAVGYGISQSSGFERKMGGLGWFLDDVAGFKVRGRLDLVQEDRGGGALGRDYGAIKANTNGNPFNFSAGPHGSPDPAGWVSPDGVSGPNTLANGANGTLYRDGRAGLSQIIGTERQQVLTSGERKLGEGHLTLSAGYAHHRQDSYYGSDALYNADQQQVYLGARWRMPVGDTLLTLGTDYRYEDLKSRGYSFVTASNNDGIDDYVYRAPAVYAQVYAPLMDNRLEADGSLRLTRHNVFGSILTPRLNLAFRHNTAWTSRLALGRGFRAPTSFFEQEHGILADSRIVRNINQPETSDNLSYALSWSSDRFSWTASANYTRIRHFARLLTGQPDPAGGPLTVTIFDSAPEPVTVRGLDWTGTWQITPSTALTLGLEKFSYDFTPGTLNFARPEQKAYLSMDSDIGPWDLTARLTWTGPQNLARFYDYANTPRYNLDGTPKADWSPSFLTMDVRAAYRFNKRWSVFAGVNNLTDYRQADHDSFLWQDRTGNLDVTHIWGPNTGRQIYAGMKVEL